MPIRRVIMSGDDHCYDVVVCGGGVSGIAAAVASARNGADTLLIERYGFLGGMTTAGLVNPFVKRFPGDGQIIGGIFKELVDRLAAKGGYAEVGSFIAFDSELLKVVADEICLDADVKLLLHSFVSSVRLEGQRPNRACSEMSSSSSSSLASLCRIESVVVTCKPLEREIAAQVFVDATGDADLAFLAGVPCEASNSSNGSYQAMIVNFRMANVDTDHIPHSDELTKLCFAARKDGRINFAVDELSYFATARRGEVHFSLNCMIRTEDPTLAEIESRRLVVQIADFLRSNVSGFEQAHLQGTGTQIGIWETRRIVGEYVLTLEDVMKTRKFEDCVARGACLVETHKNENGAVAECLFQDESYYDVPYRCLVPRGVENLLVAGRPISTDHEVHSLIRVMPVACAVGEAAGTAAALCVQQNVAVRMLDIKLLQSTLTMQGVNLGSENVRV